MRVAELKEPTEEQKEILKCSGYNPDRWLVADFGKSFLDVVSVRRAGRRHIKYRRYRGKYYIYRGGVEICKK